MHRRRKFEPFHRDGKQVNVSNNSFEEYYKKQLMLSDKEFDQFYACMKTVLPSTFRITGFRQQSRELLSLLKSNYLHSIIEHQVCESGEATGEKISVVPLEWYPGHMAWQINASRLAIRKSPELKKLQHFLVTESESGNLSRQEAVSMLPPLVLDIKEHHSVLDLCAAPGSKSAQLVELLHADAESKCSSEDLYAEPSGIVVANDLDRKRCYLMIHQVKRLQSPCVILTEEDATVYPRTFIDSPEKPGELQQMLFDRILADVPCSGDGTARKNPDLWARWTPKIGRGHHDLQKRILRRGLELLRVPLSPDSPDLPRLVYSTCSLNPVENEAVVAAILDACKGTVRLAEPSLMCLLGSEAAKKGAFVARPGLQSWSVLLGKDKWYSSVEEVPESDRGQIQASLFAPVNRADLHLEHCRRVLPHDQNTGGFFVAVLEKLGDLPWMGTATKVIKKPPQMPVVPVAADAQTSPPSTENKPDNTENESPSEPPSKKQKKDPREERRRQESAFLYLDPATDKDWPAIREYYGFCDDDNANGDTKKGQSLARFNPALIFYRAGQDSEPLRRRNLYYTNPLVKRIIEANKSLHIVSGGVKMFSLTDDKQFSGYRLLHDGAVLASVFLPRPPQLDSTPPYPPQLYKRRMAMSASERDDLLLLLREEMPLIERFSKVTQDQWHQLSVGPVLIDYNPHAPTHLTNPPDSSLLPHCRIAFAGWRGVKSLRNYIDRHERVHVLRLCGLDASVPMITGPEKKVDKLPPLAPQGDDAPVGFVEEEEGGTEEEDEEERSTPAA